MAKQTRTLVRGLRQMWPRTIPAADYEFMLLYLRRLEGAQSEEEQPARRAPAERAPRAAREPRKASGSAYQDAEAQVLEALEEARDAVGALEVAKLAKRLSRSQVYGALERLRKKKRAVRSPSGLKGRGEPLFVWSLPGKTKPRGDGLRLITKAGTPRQRAPQNSSEEIQGLVMLALEEEPEGLTGAQLAEKTGFTAQNLARPLLQLTHKNLITRRRAIDPAKPNPPFVYARVPAAVAAR